MRSNVTRSTFVPSSVRVSEQGGEPSVWHCDQVCGPRPCESNHTNRMLPILLLPVDDVRADPYRLAVDTASTLINSAHISYHSNDVPLPLCPKPTLESATIQVSRMEAMQNLCVWPFHPPALDAASARTSCALSSPRLSWGSSPSASGACWMTVP